jgi:uncharacterized protein YbjT (DUF2867 family)
MVWYTEHMKIVVFGATGRVGQKVVRHLLADGHQVRAAIHEESPFEPHDKLEIVQGDIHDPQFVIRAIQGYEAVASTLGSWGTATKDIQVAGMQNIIPAMQAAGIKRIVSITGAGAFDESDHPSWLDKFSRFLISKGASKVFRDGEEHIRLLRRSELDWTVLRSPVMQENGAPGHFVLNDRFPAPWATIVREDVASAICILVAGNDWMKHSPFIHRSK